MSETTEEKKEETAQQEETRMPSLEKGAATLFDTTTKIFWVGIPLTQSDPVTSLAILDRAKFDLLQHYNRMAMEMARLNALRQPVGMMGRAKKGISDIFDKLVKHS